jgi:Beta-lactamase enzyme family
MRRGAATMIVLLVLAGNAEARHAHRRHRPPPLNHLIHSYLIRRPGSITVAVWDVLHRQRWNSNDGMRNDTASIVKVDILEARLHQTHGHLSHDDRALAAAMIEESDNDAATALWDQDGGAIGIGAYNRRVGLRCTSLDPFGYWGLTLTCARDQLRLLSVLAEPNKLLSIGARRYQLYLMEHVVSSEAWGVSGGVPHAGVSVALKNGWLPYDDAPWIVNSIGIIHGDGRFYYIAVLTRDPNENDGIATIEHVSSIVWQHIARRRHHHHHHHH